jgi:hypothetical protein
MQNMINMISMHNMQLEIQRTLGVCNPGRELIDFSIRSREDLGQDLLGRGTNAITQHHDEVVSKSINSWIGTVPLKAGGTGSQHI